MCGSRDWHRDDIIQERLARLPRGTTVMHGGARGADRMTHIIAQRLGLDVIEYPANWQGHGRSAGVQRNLAMLNEQPDLVIAFHLNASTGTQHVIDQAVKRGIPLEVIAA